MNVRLPQQGPTARSASPWSWLRQLIHQTEGNYSKELERTTSPWVPAQVPQRLAPSAITRSVCGFCATGCSLDIHVQQDQAVNISPTPPYPVNLGAACPKGWEALSALSAANRATTPWIQDITTRTRRQIDWDHALKQFCDRLRSVQQTYGPESAAFLSTGQLVTEEMALLGCLAKFGLGMRHGDGNTRQCMATAVAAYKESFGFDAPPYTYDDLEQSDVIVLVGSNLCIAHPILWERICRNRRSPQVIVIDPRVTETAAAGTQHLQIRPKSDLFLFYAVARQLIHDQSLDHSYIAAHTQDFSRFAEFVDDFTVDVAAERTGLTHEQILAFAKLVSPGRRVSYWWTMGVNQSDQGTRTAQSLINLALMTGNIGKVGTGANSITGQCNAMGSRLFSNTTNLLGGRDFSNAEHRRDVATALRIEATCIPTQPSWPYHQILEGIDSGAIRALWIICTNPAHSWIHQDDFIRRRQKLDFLVVQDMYEDTETAQTADLFLPAAGWGEKEGTFINSERRWGVTKRVARAPGMALADFSIFRLIAEYWGCGDLFREWTSPEAAFQIIKRVSRETPCDISGIENYASIESAGGVQWPCVPSPRDVDSQRRLFTDGTFYHADGKAKFVWEHPRHFAEAPDHRYPFLLLTGRGSVAQWHTLTRTRHSPVLRSMSPQRVYVEIHPNDAAALNVESGQMVKVSSRRATVNTIAFTNSTVQQGQLFMPMHFPETNRLTQAKFDPYSHQPAYKDCAVRIDAAEIDGEVYS